VAPVFAGNNWHGAQIHPNVISVPGDTSLNPASYASFFADSASGACGAAVRHRRHSQKKYAS
jgi:hypothetical protein